MTSTLPLRLPSTIAELDLRRDRVRRRGAPRSGPAACPARGPRSHPRWRRWRILIAFRCRARLDPRCSRTPRSTQWVPALGALEGDGPDGAARWSNRAIRGLRPLRAHSRQAALAILALDGDGRSMDITGRALARRSDRARRSAARGARRMSARSSLRAWRLSASDEVLALLRTALEHGRASRCDPLDNCRAQSSPALADMLMASWPRMGVGADGGATLLRARWRS